MEHGYEYFAYYYNEFIQMFSSLDLTAQILTGILIILVAIGIGYLIYGILWLAVQLTKVGLLVAVISTYMHFVVLKMIIVAIAAQDKIEEEWTNSVNNMKWMVNVFFPTDSKYNDSKINSGDTGYNRSPRIVRVKSGLKSSQYHCTECGAQFTEKMTEAMSNKSFCYCETCGQLFVIPNQTVTQ